MHVPTVWYICIRISIYSRKWQSVLSSFWILKCLCFARIKTAGCTNSSKVRGSSKAKIARASGDVQAPAGKPSKPEGVPSKYMIM
jgi:hypothetical protein